MTFISKTDYVLWRACPKNAWLRIHRPEIYRATEVTEFEQSVMDMGIEVECIARGLFPEGVLVPGSKAEAQENTARCLAVNTETLFQAVFEREQLLAAIDVQSMVAWFCPNCRNADRSDRPSAATAVLSGL